MSDIAAVVPKCSFKIKTMEMHTCGEPLRIITSGYPDIVGDTILAKRSYVRKNLDHLRKALMLEPRGHYDMYGALLVKPDHPRAHLASLFMHNEGYSTMCGHATLALARYAVDFGLVEPVSPETEINLQCPCGLVRSFVEYDDKRKTSGRARFLSSPAFVFRTDIKLNVPNYGELTIDISYGGAFYALVSADQLGLDLGKSSFQSIQAAGTAVTMATKDAVILEHPDSPDLAFLYGTIITDGEDTWSEEPTTNICNFADSQIDRSPCGSGVTARIALQLHKGLIDLDQTRSFRSGVTGTTFTGKAVEKTKVGRFDEVVVEISGKGHYIGESTFICEDDDELGKGFVVQ
ncbi:trans-L-3-hydroxyproline dehydratase-like [Lytechinus variegatus]|uniref:trans-L-3-hydroxyproline dehydratase-like n=1 Tax=Lytechinus variegatus TaxID=7654 RepID=UPI001BB23481|nr:trans-L-3-hydroxyproline dehydratase-like [Lytechinus variegatus]